jgi:hypothetical protein
MTYRGFSLSATAPLRQSLGCWDSAERPSSMTSMLLEDSDNDLLEKIANERFR